MKFLKDNVFWIAPSCVMIAVASGFLDRENGFRLFSSSDANLETRTDVTVSRQKVTSGQTASNEISSAASSLSEDERNARRVAAALSATQVQQDLAQEVTRSASLDLSVAMAAAKPEITPEIKPAQASARVPLSSNNGTDIFVGAQKNLAFDNSCAEDLKSLASDAKVYFPAGGLSAGDAGLNAARLIGMVARDCPGYMVQVEGHSDPSGDPLTNQKLSQKRAETVIARLTASGVSTEGFVAVGYGDTRPSGVNGPNGSAYYDRRVEFSVLPTGQRASLQTRTNQWQPPVADCVGQLETRAVQARQFFAPRSITVKLDELAAVFQLAADVANCDGARLRIVGHHSDQPGLREDSSTGRMRALALMSTFVAAGYNQETFLIGAPSWSVGIKGQPGLPNSRVDFQVVAD